MSSFCRECGSPLKTDFKFCGECGATVSSSTVRGRPGIAKDSPRRAAVTADTFSPHSKSSDGISTWGQSQGRKNQERLQNEPDSPRFERSNTTVVDIRQQDQMNSQNRRRSRSVSPSRRGPGNDKAGWLQKQGLLTNWKKRYCVLFGGTLYLYKSELDSKPSDKYTVKGAQVEVTPSFFRLMSNGKLLCALQGQYSDMSSWVDALVANGATKMQTTWGSKRSDTPAPMQPQRSISQTNYLTSPRRKDPVQMSPNPPTPPKSNGPKPPSGPPPPNALRTQQIVAEPRAVSPVISNSRPAPSPPTTDNNIMWSADSSSKTNKSPVDISGPVLLSKPNPILAKKIDKSKLNSLDVEAKPMKRAQTERALPTIKSFPQGPKCESCGRQWAANVTFCGDCGSRLATG